MNLPIPMPRIPFKLLFIPLTALSFSVKGQQILNDSVTVSLQPEYDAVSTWHKFWLGDNNRKLWATPIKIRIVHLQNEKGGMTIVQRGGGMQTKSLRLKDAQGVEWVLRTLQKYPDRKLPENLKATVIKDILQDQVSAINPFGALTVPSFASALGILHSTPEIVFVQDDPGLMEYRKEFANASYLLERYVPGDDSNNTLKVQAKLQEDNDHKVDQKMVLRARLLDMIIGDWDRHEGQWRWEKSKDDGETTYMPIPRDRDQVFYRTSGIFPWIVSHQWLKSRFQPFGENLRDVKGWNFGAKDFDRYFLNEMDKGDWNKQIAFVKEHLTDELIENTLKSLPAAIYKTSGERIVEDLKSRRDKLDQYALEYYDFIAHTVDVPMSDKTEQFIIDVAQNGDVEVKVKNIKKTGELGRTLYHRKFEFPVTKEIRLYGLAGKDKFTLTGNTKSNIKIRMVGGDDLDAFNVDPELKSKGSLYIYDRKDEENDLPATNLAKRRLSTDTLVNQYQPVGFKYNRTGPVFRGNYNIDQGIQIGVGYMDERHGFQKIPYASKQEFWADYSTGRKSFILNYTGDFKKVIGQNNLKIDINSLGPNNQSNFFGLGNETEFSDTKGRKISYYRNRYDYLTAKGELYRSLATHWTGGINFQTAYYASQQGDNEKRFLNNYDTTNPLEEVFENKLHLGLGASLTYDSRDNTSIPRKGWYWTSEFLAQKQLNGPNESFEKLRSELSWFLNPSHTDIIISNKIGGGTTFGNPYFYQLMQLGGVNNLRGFHTRRFAGKTSAYYNLDLRFKLFNFNSYIVPGSVGIVGFNDVGRVWQPSEKSNTWHHGYGGGIYVVPADLILLQGAVGFSKEGALPYISLVFNL